MGDVSYANHPYCEFSEPPERQRSRPRDLRFWERGKGVWVLLACVDGASYRVVEGVFAARLMSTDFQPELGTALVDVAGNGLMRVAQERIFETQESAEEEMRRWNEFMATFYVPVKSNTRVSLPRLGRHSTKSQEQRVA